MTSIFPDNAHYINTEEKFINYIFHIIIASSRVNELKFQWADGELSQ